MNSRRPKTIQRQENLEKIYDIYKNFQLDRQISSAITTAYQIGTLDKLQMQYSFLENPDISDSDTDSE